MLSGGERGLGSADVAVLGLAAVLGAGLFAAWGPAAAAAGEWLPVSVAVAGLVAAVTAASSAGLVRRADARHAPADTWGDPGTDFGTDPALERGGCLDGLLALDAGRPDLPLCLARLGHSAFLVGRTCAAAAAAHVFGSYVLPSAALPAAVAVVVVTTVLAVVGVRWTARGSYALVGGIAAVLAVVVVTGLLGPEPSAVAASATGLADPAPSPGGGLLGTLCGAGVIGFAFAGVARVAVLARAARDPAAALRSAVPVAVVAAVAAYVLVAVALLVSLGAGRLSMEPAPLAAVVDAGRAPALGVLVRVAAAVAAGSALLSVLAGVGRTASEMARLGELPRALAVRGRRGNPRLAEIAGGLAAVVVVLVAGQVATIVLSACCMLVGYAVVNAAALRLTRQERVWPRWTAAVGVVVCLLLAVLLPAPYVLVAVAAIVVVWLVAAMMAGRSGAR